MSTATRRCNRRGCYQNIEKTKVTVTIETKESKKEYVFCSLGCANYEIAYLLDEMAGINFGDSAQPGFGVA